MKIQVKNIKQYLNKRQINLLRTSPTKLLTRQNDKIEKLSSKNPSKSEQLKTCQQQHN